MLKRDAQAAVRQLSDDLLRVEIDGEQYLAAAACPHRKGRLVFGYVNARKLRITCPLHYSTFDLERGHVISGPADSPLAVKERADGVSCWVADSAERSEADEDNGRRGV